MDETVYPPAPSVSPQPPSVSPGTSHTPIIIAGIAVLLLVGGVLAYLRMMPSGGTPDASESPSAVPSASSLDRSSQVQWQAREELPDLGYIPVPDVDLGYEYEPKYYRIGTFTDGKYKGSDLILAYGLAEMGGPPVYRFVRTPSGPVLLTQQSDEYWQDTTLPAPPFTKDNAYIIPELRYPAFLDTPYEGFILQGSDPLVFGIGREWSMFHENELVKVFDSPYGPVYTDTLNTVPPPTPEIGSVPYFKNFGFYIRRPDDFVVTYLPRFGFVRDESVDVRWSDNGYSSGEYVTWNAGGCGRADYLAVMQPYELDPSRDLKEAGMTDADGPVYVLTNDRHELLETAFSYAPEHVRAQSDAYAGFLRSHPIFFWKDPLGRFIKFQSKDIVPPGECGKPVIYLYPEETTEVSVQVEPVGGMSFSEPEYGDGWTVTAQPDGTLTAADGRVWPYLFWEGTGGLYQTPHQGWVVPQADVEGLLDDKLALLGLNTGEIADFKEFWLPRMQDAPYYFVSFLGNRAMDALAPLNIVPKPDTVIRVLMDFAPLEQPVDVTPPVIRTPARAGFTVVEWGGVIR